MERRPERARGRGGRGIERAGDEPLHVGRPAPVEPPVPPAQDERIGAPRLPLDRHHVGMPREQHAGGVRRPDRREQAGLAAGVVSNQHAFHAVPGEEAPDPFDELEVRRGADRLEPDQPGEESPPTPSQRLLEVAAPDAVALELVVEGLARHPQRLDRRPDVAAMRGERVADQPGLVAVDPLGQAPVRGSRDRRRRGLSPPARGRARPGRRSAAARGRCPASRGARGGRGPRRSARAPAGRTASADALEEMREEERDVAAPLAQRRDAQGDHVQPVVRDPRGSRRARPDRRGRPWSPRRRAGRAGGARWCRAARPRGSRARAAA